jgi:hypothetical protein
MSEAVLGALLCPPGARLPRRLPPAPADPLGDDDLHLALYACYELHYQSFDGVDERWEWDPGLIAFRGGLERAFEEALDGAVGPVDPPEEPVAEALRRLVRADDGPSLSRWVEQSASLDHFREFAAHRSAYQLKEADPHSWALPRLRGAPKAALVEIQGDEYGAGVEARMHSSLFAGAMRALDLDDAYGAYLDVLPGVTLATVNLMSLFGLHRRRLGAIVGHLAVFEMTSSVPNRRYATALRRLGLGADATGFYDEHVEADAVHEVLAAHDLAGSLVRDRPALARDVLFGARALLLLDARFARHVLDCWDAGVTSLRRPLPA